MRSQENARNASDGQLWKITVTQAGLFENKNGLVEVAAIVTFAWEIRFKLHRGNVLRQLEDLKELETAERMLIFHSTSSYIAEITCTKGFE